MKESKPEQSLRRRAELRAALAELPRFHDTKSPTDKMRLPQATYFAVTLREGEPCPIRPMSRREWHEKAFGELPKNPSRRQLEDISSYNG